MRYEYKNIAEALVEDTAETNGIENPNVDEVAKAKFFDSVKNHNLDIDAFHQAFDGLIEEENKWWWFDANHKYLKDANLWGKIKNYDYNDDLKTALKSLWIAQFSNKKSGKTASAKRTITEPQAPVEINALSNIEYLDDSVKTNTVLDNVNKSITETSADYSDIKAFFDVCKDSNKITNFTDDEKKRYLQIWNKLVAIANSQTKGQFADISDPFVKIQYSYNAHWTEVYLYKKFGWSYGTTNKDHDTFHTSDSKDEEGSSLSKSISDFININIKFDIEGGLKFEATQSVEIKNFGTPMRARSYLNSNDRKMFHDADFILMFIMSEGKWYFRANRPIITDKTLGQDLTDQLGTPSDLVTLGARGEDGLPIVSAWGSYKKGAK